MKVVIRVDASLKIGTGHVMRCLTLAQALKDSGSEVCFICRLHQGNLIKTIQQLNFDVHALELSEQIEKLNVSAVQLDHAEWLGVSQTQDAEECKPILMQINPDWLIVDHYAIDQTWQSALKGCFQQLMVIDDLTDRVHVADLLLNQNYGTILEDYHALVNQKCRLLVGCYYALLREEFAQWRQASLTRRQAPILQHLLITLGGADVDNVTGGILAQLTKLHLPDVRAVMVVMGANAPHLETVQAQAASLPWPTEVRVNVTNMAELMTQADLAIGAAGATTWERCCLGLPTIQLVIALNQERVAARLEQDGIVKTINHPQDLEQLISNAVDWMPKLSHLSASICDGRGCERVVQAMYSFN